MELRDTKCCALQEICKLSFDPTPEDSMVLFCKQSLGAKVAFHGYQARAGKLYSFYVFTYGTASDNGSYGNRPYGVQFAEFIREHKLGTVWDSPKISNEAFHPSSYNQIWIWMPDDKAVVKWWKEKQETGTKCGQSKRV